MSFPDSPRTGFTIVEVLCALVLSAALMVAMLGVVAGMSRHAAVLTRESDDALVAFERQFRRDIMNSQSLSLGPEAVVLTGYLSRNRQSGALIGKPAEVHYEIKRYQDQAVLQRREHLLSQLNNVPDERNLALFTFSRFRLRPAGEKELREHYSGPMPKQFQIVLTTSEKEVVLSFVH